MIAQPSTKRPTKEIYLIVRRNPPGVIQEIPADPDHGSWRPWSVPVTDVDHSQTVAMAAHKFFRELGGTGVFHEYSITEYPLQVVLFDPEQHFLKDGKILTVHTTEFVFHREDEPDQQGWYLKHWNLSRFQHMKGIQSLKETSPGVYLLRLDFSHGYRQFILTDNGGELNFQEIVRHGEGSMYLPMGGSYSQRNELALYYRIMQFIKGDPIDYDHSDESLTEDDWKTLNNETSAV